MVTGYLHRGGTQILDSDNNPAKLCGVQYADWLHISGNWEDSHDITESKIQTIKNNGGNVVEFNEFLWSYFEPTQGNYSSTEFAKLDSLLSWCQTNQIYCIITWERITNPWVNSFPDWITISDSTTDELGFFDQSNHTYDDMRNAFRDFMVYVVNRYKSNPFFILDFFNEPLWEDDGYTYNQLSSNYASVITWLDDAVISAGYLNPLFVDHPIINYYASTRTPIDRSNVVWEAHCYMVSGTYDYVYWCAALDQVINWYVTIMGKPLFIGEFCDLDADWNPSDQASDWQTNTANFIIYMNDYMDSSSIIGHDWHAYCFLSGDLFEYLNSIVYFTSSESAWLLANVMAGASGGGEYYSVGVTTSGGNGYTSPLGGPFQVAVGTNFQVEAFPDPNYEFSYWLRNSVQVSTDPVYVITDGVADEEYVMEAYFTYSPPPPPTEGGSVVAPSIALVFGAVAPPQGDVIEMMVHLGCTKEVSSFEVKLQNWDGKYSPSGTYPILVGTDGSISLGRGATCPLLITCHVEGIAYKTTPDEHYVTVTGRCWGERLFRYAVTQAYAAYKGEAIVKNLIDYHAGISHVRGGVELIEDSDTTYTSLDYTESPAWDILKYVAQSADKSGVIGYDFRVAPDGKFEFFPLLSKTNSTVLVEQIDDSSNYRKDISRIRNRIRIYGIADKSVPLSKVTWTRSLTPADGAWAAGAGVISLDATGAPDGGACIKLSVPGSLYFGSAVFTLVPGSAVNTELYPLLDVQFKLDTTYSGTGTLVLWDSASKAVTKSVSVSPDAAWRTFEVGVGSAYVNQWESIQSGFDWTQIRVVLLYFYFPENVGTGNFRIHQLYFGGRRYFALEENTASQSAYGIREMVETDEELWTDNECDLRAKALLNYLSLPAEYLTLISTVIDYGSTPIQAGDKVHVHLPNENGDSDFRVDEVEYRVINDGQVLETALELGKSPPQLADYLYGSRAFTVNVEKLSRTKLGRRGVPVTTGGGAGAGSYFNSNVEIDKASPVVNLLTGRVLKACIGFDGVNFFVVSYTGDLVLRAQSTIIRPYTNDSDDLGSPSFRFKNAYLGAVYIGNSEVITAAKVLQNVTADAGIIATGGATADVPVAKVGGGTRTLHFENSKYTGYTDS